MILVGGLILSLMFITGCPVILAGAGAGAGVYTYGQGELKRVYQAAFDKAESASTDTLKSLKINIEEKTSDGIKTTMHGRRTDGTPVTVKLEMITPDITEISVRTGVLGLWDKQVSELIHASIAQRL
jgi:hypothetical protein